jgi:hypothetical protein
LSSTPMPSYAGNATALVKFLTVLIRFGLLPSCANARRARAPRPPRTSDTSSSAR